MTSMYSVNEIVREASDFGLTNTCCIDKRSSAELSEAINSMHRWYQNAIECYAYLTDVLCGDEDVEFVVAPPESRRLRTSCPT